MTLAALQSAFQDAVLGAADGALAQHLAPNQLMRVAVYRATVQGSLAEVLAAAFPVTQRIVGPAYFAALAGRFAVSRPPRLPQLSAYGADFPDFVADAGAHHKLPYLADVARLEWARAESYFAAEAPALAPGAVAAIAPEALDDFQLSLHPATRLVRSSYPIHRIWQVNQPEVTDVPAVDMSVPETVLLTRKNGQVALRVIAPGDAAFVDAIAAGSGLGKAADGTFDLESSLRDHLIGGTFRGVQN